MARKAVRDAVAETVSVPALLQAARYWGVKIATAESCTGGLIAAACTDITAALESGELTPLPVIRFPLEQIAAAHDAVQSRSTGKVLIDLP